MERERYIMNHKKRIIFILLITISISFLTCIPNIVNIINNKVQENKYIKLLDENKILLREIEALNKTINELSDKSYMIENVEDYKKDLTKELNTKKEELDSINKNMSKLRTKIETQKTKNEEIKKYIIK